MSFGQSIELIPQVFNITSHRNQGGAWGILQGKMVFFYILTTVVIGIIIFILQRYGRTNTLLAFGLCLNLGGAIGNFADRLFRKEVVDFLHITFIDFPVFNVADMALTAGVILLMVHMLFDGKVSSVENN